MLSSVLNSKRAIEVNIQIIRVFTKLRQIILDNEGLRDELAELRQQTDERFQVVFETLDHLLAVENKPKRKIGFTVKEKMRAYRRRTEMRMMKFFLDSFIATSTFLRGCLLKADC